MTLAIVVAAAGFFAVGQDGGRALFTDPEGRPFYLRGCGTVDRALDRAPDLLRRCGFNAVAQPADEMKDKGFAWTYNFNVARRFSEQGKDYVRRNPSGHGWPNVLHPEFEGFVRRFVAERIADKRDDRMLLGYFIDNELAFDMASDEEIERYFEVTTRTIRELDPNHLILGCRFMGGKITSNAKVWETCGRFCDVVSVNIYPDLDLYRRRISVHDVYFGGDGRAIDVTDLLPKLSARAGKPVIVTEWSFPSLDTPFPNVKGGGCRVDTQRERAEASALFVRQLYSVKCSPGYFYFRWYDTDDWSAERTNYGLVTNAGKPYEPLVEAFAEVQGNFNKYFTLPPPAKREWPALGDDFFAHAAKLDLAGEPAQLPDGVEFPRSAFELRPIVGRNACAIRNKAGKSAKLFVRVAGMPQEDEQRWMKRYKAWPNDAIFLEDGTYFGFVALPQSDYTYVKLYRTRAGGVGSDIRVREDGTNGMGFFVWGRGTRTDYEKEVSLLKRAWEAR